MAAYNTRHHLISFNLLQKSYLISEQQHQALLGDSCNPGLVRDRQILNFVQADKSWTLSGTGKSRTLFKRINPGLCPGQEKDACSASLIDTCLKFYVPWRTKPPPFVMAILPPGGYFGNRHSSPIPRPSKVFNSHWSFSGSKRCRANQIPLSALSEPVES